mmetsp:Transcript_9206/g.15680  ORF Transcript_9206/g.15680 Transcript_9206/m.15680 type:complete len:138 (+) Transcript_9206:387-800(+)|eukprot:CAMPEP_0168591426 /NCGR_PEP_ID=MMETSP0420-20121227/7130_1 /TAXON_ID=498008 /ORGANISM="Pessonella sp." /LENGTH=137 /DNA_ID=CAMNT_0008627221 /DNA_START=250 /DNA_END=663 /DNA_ORIENTATION=+
MADCAIIMFDLTAMSTYRNVAKWHRDLVRVCDNIPIVLVGNKVDCKQRQVNARNITFHRKKNLFFFEISAKTNYNFEKPFVSLARRLFHDKSLRLIEEVAVLPPEIAIDAQTLAAWQQEAIEAAAVPLDDNDDDNDI